MRLVPLRNGDGPGLVNNCCFPSSVASSYAPAGKNLASVSLIGRIGKLCFTTLFCSEETKL
jgi:hypothetical protein